MMMLFLIFFQRLSHSMGLWNYVCESLPGCTHKSALRLVCCPDVLINLLYVWCGFKLLAKLDSACCNELHRPDFLDALATHVFMKNDSEIHTFPNQNFLLWVMH